MFIADGLIVPDNNGQLIPKNTETIYDLADAVEFAWNEGGAKVINNSWGFENEPTDANHLRNAIKKATQHAITSQ